MIDINYKKYATFHQSNKTYDVTNFVSGSRIDLFSQMMKQLNASCSLYRRNDPYFGGLKNGTWNGMFKNLIEDNVDFIGTGCLFQSDFFQQKDQINNFHPNLVKYALFGA